MTLRRRRKKSVGQKERKEKKSHGRQRRRWG